MSLFDNNLNEILQNKTWNDTIYELESNRLRNNIHNSKYIKSQNIYNDTKGTLLENHNLFKKGNLPKYYYDELYLSQVDQPIMVNEYGDQLENGRDMTLFNTLTKQPIVVSSYIVNNKSVKRYAQATTSKQKISNAFDFETLQRIEPKDFDSRLLKAINNKNK